MTALYTALRWALPYVIAIAVAFGLVWFVYERGVSDEHERRVAQVDTIQARHIADVKAIGEANEKELARLTQDARDKEAANALRMAALDEKHFKELQDEKANSIRTIDGLRSGAVRVRDKYTCSASGTSSAASGVPSTYTSAGMGDGAASRGLGPEDAAAIVGAADIGDGWAVQLRACQAIVRSDRGMK